MKTKGPTYADAIEKVLHDSGGSATNKTIYEQIWNYIDESEIDAKTPNNTIRAYLYTDPRFKQLTVGEWALDNYNGPLSIKQPKTPKEEKDRNHTNIQGMLLEIGNYRSDVLNYKPETFGTYVSIDNKGDEYGNLVLGDLATLKILGKKEELFTYSSIVTKIKYADVIWFNRRGFPSHIFEVETSPIFIRSLRRCMELEDFCTKFHFVSSPSEKNKFMKEKNNNAFHPIAERVDFWSYEQVETLYELIKLSEVG